MSKEYIEICSQAGGGWPVLKLAELLKTFEINRTVGCLGGGGGGDMWRGTNLCSISE